MQGAVGIQGPSGPTGATGGTGLQGPPGVGSFAYFSYIGTQEIEPGAAVQFNQTPIPAVLPVAIGFTAPSSIIVNSPGIYELNYYLLPQEANVTLAAFIGATEIPLTRYTATSSADHFYGQALVNIAVTPATLTLRNVDPMQSINVDNGSLANTVSLSLIISKLS